MKHVFFILITYCFILLPVYSSNNDSSNILKLSQFIDLIQSNHPYLKIAANKVEQANALKLKAFSVFEPNIDFDQSRKEFDQQFYFNDKQINLNVPIGIGQIQYKIQQLNGDRTLSIETQGLTSTFGVNIPLLRNLIIDERRAFFKSAEIYRKSSLEDQKNMINDLFYKAINQYYDWVFHYKNLLLYEDYYKLNISRYQFVKSSYLLGERAEVDTIEALTQLTQAEYMLIQKKQKWIESGIKLSTFIWNENQTYIIRSNFIPGETELDNISKIFNFPDLDSLGTMKLVNHPLIQINNYNLQALELDKKLKFQEYLPKVDLNVNVLSKQINALSNIPNLLNNEYFKFNVEFPLLFLKARSVNRLANLKVKEMNYNNQILKVELDQRLFLQFNNYQNAKQQRNVLIQNLNYNNKLIEAERAKFAIGESNLFILNSRELKWFESQEKYNFNEFELAVDFFAIYWAAGELGNIITKN